MSLSYVHGASATPLIGENIGVYFDSVCDRFADQMALVSVYQNIRWTYAELREQVDRLACGLLRLGLKHGDRIGIWSQNNYEWVLMQFATARTGLVMVNINPAYRLAEVEYALNKVGCKALVVSPKFKSSDYLDMLYTLAPEMKNAEIGQIKANRLPHLRTIIRLGEGQSRGMLNFSALLSEPTAEERQALRELIPTLQCDEAVNIQFTSGTTGSPKGATLTHHNLLNNGFFVGECLRLTPADSLCIPVPLYHCFGMVLSNLACVTHGATMVFPSEAFDPQAVLETVEREKCTALNGVPTMFIAMLEHPEFEEYDLSSLRTGIMAGSPCPIEVMKRVEAEMHMSEVTIAYGMTETSPVSFQSLTTAPIEKRVTTVGQIHPHVEVKIVDNEGRIVPRGVTGELLTRGYSVMLGYWGDEERTREAIDAAGWMHTGDLAIIDDEGYCNIVGRVKDMVIRGGENLYPREIEEFLYRHPKVQDVQVIGVPDKKYGEELCAWVKLKEGVTCTQDEVREFCQGQIAHYKIPRYIEFVEEFPMTITGKVQKFVMRDRMKEKLGLDEDQTA